MPSTTMLGLLKAYAETWYSILREVTSPWQGKLAREEKHIHAGRSMVAKTAQAP
jgi:hypothetical protein